ncbi:dynamin family protein [Pseudonocardia sp. RS11V-5]|uniref:dynamin family protein n=1 Tax=Pseudonocardia terrae TaxID=2905831 RepID=UPI001E2A3126|nr:dynamin family protein [Pseudonocardia terrae]MCE3555581.1 dynamin family protein [Pseudonocardia terrae]
MSENRDRLVTAAASISVDRPAGVAGLVAGLHRDPVTARLPIEAVALPPVPDRQNGRLLISALLAVPTADRTRVHRPFGTVTWNPSDGSVVQLSEWGTELPETVTGAERTDTTWPLPESEDRMRTVCAALDELAAGRTPNLTELYRSALPSQAIAWYQALVPAAVPWLPDQQTWALPRHTDVGSALGGWIRDVAAIAAETNAPALGAQLEMLAEQRMRPGFRVAVVGEFNKGKSTLVNRLVGHEVVATGPVPTTALFVVVMAEDAASGSVRTAGDHEIAVPCAWLATIDTELVDTPGTNEAGEDRTPEVRRAVTLSDAVLLTVSATSPLSRSERELIAQEVLRRHVPFFAVVVGFLDQLPPEDRAAALSSVRSKVQQLAPETPVLTSPGPVGGEDELVAIRDLIADYAKKNEDRRWRTNKIASAVADIAEAVADVAGQAAVAAALHDAERTAAVERERAELARDAAMWDGLRVEFETRRRALVRRVSDSLSGDADVLVGALRHELLRAPDPKAYWEHDAPYRLRRELAALAHKYESLVLAGMTSDIEWLDTTLAERFDVVTPTTRPAARLAAPHTPLPEADMTDLSRRKMMTRIGAAGGTVAGYVLAGAVGLAMPPVALAMAGGLAAAILAERSLRNATEGQRQVVDQLLRQAVDAAIAEVTEQAALRIRSLYAEILDGMSARRAAWRRSRLAASAEPTRSATQHSALADRATALATTIRAAVADDCGTSREDS